MRKRDYEHLIKLLEKDNDDKKLLAACKKLLPEILRDLEHYKEMAGVFGKEYEVGPQSRNLAKWKRST